MTERGRRVGSYDLVQELGRGGMGVVWRARDVALERDVAIKMIVPEPDDVLARENAARFLVEARVAAGIRSKHVAHAIELGTTPDGAAYFVMELLEGETLLALVNRERRLDPPRAIRLARQIARGMTAAHALGVVHRDLKPGNVMLVTLDGEREVVKIVDFGLAKRDGAGPITQQGAVVGTLQYMAPEQLRGEEVDGRTDIFALGVVLYRMITGRSPFEATSLAAMIDLQLGTRPPSPSQVVGGVSPTLDDVVMRCLEKDREARYRSMDELEKALAHAASAPVQLVDPREELRASAEREESAARRELLAPLSDASLIEPPPHEPASTAASTKPHAPGSTQAFDSSPRTPLHARGLDPSSALCVVDDAPLARPPRSVRVLAIAGVLALVVAVAIAATRGRDAPLAPLAPSSDTAASTAPAASRASVAPSSTPAASSSRTTANASEPSSAPANEHEPSSGAPANERAREGEPSTVSEATGAAVVTPTSAPVVPPTSTSKKPARAKAKPDDVDDRGFIRVRTKE